MDWMTLAIEVMGAVIFCVWVVIPIREYRSIYQRLRQRPAGPGDESGKDAGFPVVFPPKGEQENHA
jgi:hypothetical protein